MHHRFAKFAKLAPAFAFTWSTFEKESPTASTTNGSEQFFKGNDPSVYMKDFKTWDSDWDGRRAKSLVRQPPPNAYFDSERFSKSVDVKRSKAIRHLILIRHGQYEDTKKSDDQRVLTELGRKQAQVTGARLRDLRKSKSLTYSILMSSTLQRAKETADFIAKELNNGDKTEVKRKADFLLEEGTPCPPEPAVAHWRPIRKWLDDGARIEAAFRQYFYRAPPEQTTDSYEVIVCHGNVIRYFVCRALQFPPQGWLRMSVAHASITWISILPDGRVSLRCLGDSGHLPMELVTR